MPNVSSFSRNIIELYKNGIANGPAIKMVKKTPFVENTASTLTLSHSGITNLVKDTFGRILHKNTLSCNEGFRVYKICGNHPKVSTITVFNNDGIRMYKKVCDNTGNIIHKIIAYDEKGLNPKEVPDMLMNILI